MVRTFEDLKINLEDQTSIIPCVSRQKTKYKRVTDFKIEVNNLMNFIYVAIENDN